MPHQLTKEQEEKLKTEIDLLLGEYGASGDESRVVNVLELVEKEIALAVEAEKQNYYKWFRE